MSEMNKTPTANRLHISIFGRRNAGKSSLINALTGQSLSIVSEHAGTTTDPVYKAMEILPVGPVVIIDTAGIDDEGDLGELRIKKSIEVISKTDIAIIVVPPDGFTSFDENLIVRLKDKNVPFLIVVNKVDIQEPNSGMIEFFKLRKYKYIMVSALKKIGIEELKKAIITNAPKEFEQPSIIGDLISPGDSVVLVIPIDTGMPKGRLILPQVQIMRDILDNDAMAYITKEREVRHTLENMVTKPKLVITDSQAFMKVSADVPENIPLTSFSILFARHKGDLLRLVKGAKALKDLKNGDRVLIAESCTHHQQPDDIGRVKIPRWIREQKGEGIDFDFANGRDYPEELSKYKLIIHCAGCMLNRKEMIDRIDVAEIKGIPIVNYGVAIAYLHGIMERALKPFPEVAFEWEDE